jgi:hypothetical protein
MTMPDERTRALRYAGEFLRKVSRIDGVPEDLKQQARAILWHYPSTLDIEYQAKYGDDEGGVWLLPEGDMYRKSMNHQEHDARSLALHRLAIKRIREQPELLQSAHEIVTRWMRSVTPGSRAYLETWQYLIEQGVDALEEVACRDDERSTALRQSSPISCTLPIEERQEFLLAWKKDHPEG